MVLTIMLRLIRQLLSVVLSFLLVIALAAAVTFAVTVKKEQDLTAALAHRGARAAEEAAKAARALWDGAKHVFGFARDQGAKIETKSLGALDHFAAAFIALAGGDPNTNKQLTIGASGIGGLTQAGVPTQDSRRPARTEVTTSKEEASAAKASQLALDRINQYRQVAGLRPVRLDEHLSLAADRHAIYMATNSVSGHDEDPADSNYFGAVPVMRIAKAGYFGLKWQQDVEQRCRIGPSAVTCTPAPPGRSGEVIAVSGNPSPEAAVDSLIDAPYHRLGLLNPLFSSVGYGRATDNKWTWYQYHVLDLACSSDCGSNPQTVVYPAANQGDVPRGWDGKERPNPLRLHDHHGGSVGYPVTLAAPMAKSVRFLSAAITAESGQIPFWVNHPGNDAELKDKMILIPRTELPAQTRIQVKISVEVDGRPVNHEWSFVTR